MNDVLDNLKANLTAKSTAIPTPTKQLDPIAEPVKEELKPVVAVEKPKFQHYISSLISVQLITTMGKRIKFNNYSYITEEKDCIDYLDDEIAKGLRGIYKGELLTKEESDPKERYKAQIIAEHYAALAKGKDFGTTEGAKPLGAASSKVVVTGHEI